jgi:diadenosine tetraphosphatase ApaH/serine/threonine PP2A family protein phosphatase
MLERGDRYLLNPGSVGQPRDGLRDASYAVVELDGDGPGAIEFRRIGYDVDLTQRLMRDRGLPYRLVERLGYGR